MPESSPPPDATSPTHHDAYAVAERISIGHAGVVYRAVQNSTGREVILKVLAPHATHPLDPVAVAALKESVNRVQHPCVAEWLDAHQDPDGFVIVHEFRKGIAGNLFPSQRKLTPAEGRLLAMQLLGALLAGERAMIPHGDLKPSNIVISDDPAQGLALKVLDWGLSACREHQPHESLLCFPPERLEGGPPSVASDLFSAGVTLTFLVTGCYPTHGSNAEEVLAVWQRFDPSTIGKARPDLDEHFCKWLNWLLRLNPEDRPASVTQAREVLEQVIAYAAHEQKKAAAPTEPEPETSSNPETRQSPPQRTTSRPTAAAIAGVNPIAAAARSAQQETQEPEPPERRSLAAKITLGLLVICGFMVAFAGLGWWAEYHYGAGWIGERWHSIWHPEPKPEPIAQTKPEPKANPPAPSPAAPAAKRSSAPAAPAASSTAARDPFKYPVSPKLDGLAGGSGWSGAWRANNVEIAQSQDKKYTFARIGGAQDASATRVFVPFSKVAQKGFVLAFNLRHPGADCTTLAIDTLGTESGKAPAPLIVTPKNGALQFSLEGGAQKLDWPAGKMVRVLMQWTFKKQKDGKYEVTVRAWLNPDPKSKNPVAKSPAASRILKGFTAPPAIAFSISSPAGAREGATLSDLRMAPTIQEALK